MKQSHVGAAVGIVGVAGSLILLLTKQVSEPISVTLVVVFLLAALVVAALDRVRVVDAKGFRIEMEETKREMREAKERVASLEQRLARMYGDIGPQAWRAPDKAAIGLPGQASGIVTAHAVVNYVSGCIRRERYRLASVFVGDDKRGEELARAIVDLSLDNQEFAWTPGPEPFLKNPIRPPDPSP